jgi:ABC-type branched-subunit amino acid transport system ATPase component
MLARSGATAPLVEQNARQALGIGSRDIALSHTKLLLEGKSQEPLKSPAVSAADFYQQTALFQRREFLALHMAF